MSNVRVLDCQENLESLARESSGLVSRQDQDATNVWAEYHRVRLQLKQVNTI